MGAVKYIADFRSSQGLPYRISIWDEQASGDATYFCAGPEGFELSYEGAVEDIHKAFIPSRLEFKFNVEDQDAEDFVVNVATGEPDRFKIFVTYGSEFGSGVESLFWQGTIQGEGIEIQDDAFPYEVALTASDISFFREIDYASGGLPIEGEVPIVEVLTNVLSLTGHADFYTNGAHGFEPLVQTKVNWYSASMATTGDPMLATFVDQKTFYGYNSQGGLTFKNCQQVIEEVCRIFNCRFYQAPGFAPFHFDQVDQLVNSGQKFYAYNRDGTGAGSGTVTGFAYEIDQVDLFRTAGKTSFYPGLNYAEREYKYRRNYLDGQSAKSGSPLTYQIGNLPLLTYLVTAEQPQFTFKFNIVYKIKESDGTPLKSPFNMPPIGADSNGVIGYVPLFRMGFEVEGVSDSYIYRFAQAMAERPVFGIEASAESRYRQLIGTKKEWVKSYEIPSWGRADVFPPEILHFEIIDEEEYGINFAQYTGLEYVPEERTITVELALPRVTALAQDLTNAVFTFDILDVYNRRRKQWTRQSPAYTLDDIDWRVENFELIVHGNTLEERPETGRKYRVTSPNNYRRVLELAPCELTALDKRTWHSLRVQGIGGLIDGQLWYRAPDTTDVRILNYLSIREVVAANRNGMEVYQCQLIDMGKNVPTFANPLEKGGKRYMMVQGTFNPVMDEWNNLTMVELKRDASDLIFSELKSDSRQGTSSALPSGNFSFSGTSNPTTSIAPLYEAASGITGSAYELQDIDLNFASGLDPAGVNTSLWVFQDATKLSYPIGFTIDTNTNEIIPTYEFQNSYLEFYYFS